MGGVVQRAEPAEKRQADSPTDFLQSVKAVRLSHNRRAVAGANAQFMQRLGDKKMQEIK